MRPKTLAAIAALTVLSSSAFAGAIQEPTCVPVLTNAADPLHEEHLAQNARCDAARNGYNILVRCQHVYEAQAAKPNDRGPITRTTSLAYQAAQCKAGESKARAQLALDDGKAMVAGN